MPPRSSHRKSRQGCLTCKQRRVKCDEKGPPCGACRLRSSSCEYAASLVPKLQASPVDPDGATTTDRAHDDPIFPSDHRLLELQLMNRWSTVTYKSLCAKVAEDDLVWQTKVPALSLQYDFLLNGVFALAAFEIASSTLERNRAPYLNAAFEYQILALGKFRPQLQDINPASHEALLCFSLILMVLALASAQFVADSPRGGHDTMVQNTITHFELLHGCTRVLESEKDYLEKNPYARKLKRFEELPRVALDPRTAAALAKLSEANERRITSSINDPYECRIKQVSYWESCKKAVSLLQEFFAKCVDSIDYQGYILGWLNMAGDDYIRTIKAGDRIALLILMYWGVLVETLGHQVWWARTFGGRLIEEISNKLLNEGEADTMTTDVILWAQKLVRSVSNR